MKVLRDDNLITISYDESLKLLQTFWKAESFQQVQKETVFEIIKEIGSYLVDYDCDYYLADQTHRGVVYTVDMQKWIAGVLQEAVLKGNVKKTAIIQPVDFIVSLSNEQTMNEVTVRADFRAFRDRESALAYLGI
ncbi:MAG: hypothetical protein IKQ46_02220 [Bacteroidales bacterium]|jgi:hypothetical protein|nr:hypothetical protein [Bacteroidales bacterium]